MRISNQRVEYSVPWIVPIAAGLGPDDLEMPVKNGRERSHRKVIQVDWRAKNRVMPPETPHAQRLDIRRPDDHDSVLAKKTRALLHECAWLENVFDDVRRNQHVERAHLLFRRKFREIHTIEIEVFLGGSHGG